MRQEFTENKLFKERANWHRVNKSIVSSYFNNTCQKCDRLTSPKAGTIHHLQYTGFDYNKSGNELIKRKAITWLCKKCHKFEHIAYNLSEVNYKIKHSGYCAICNNFSWYAWYRLGYGRYGDSRPSPFPLCKKCSELLIKEGVISIQIINDRKFLDVHSRERWSEKGVLMIDGVLNKDKKADWGDPNQKEKWQNHKNEGQLSLF